ncbi:hypothetical protein JTB14_024860 [Gonioctena quinquepunctata]|nr:hypothetical protein JTB14_024860 [Gonioctena quinquepunctata]
MDKAGISHPPALPNGPSLRNGGSDIHSRKDPKNNTSRDGSVRSKTSQSSQGFRLVEHNYQNDETGSVYSIYKQKIDSMFESDSSSTKNSVQAKIEKMFSDVAMDNGIPMDDIGIHNFSVDYLGSVPLPEKVTSLTGLQNPLKDLYFAYKKLIRSQKPLTGRLEISSSGLKVQYQGEKGDLEQLNSFPTIAVWSAVKFVIHGSPKFTYAFLPLITDPDNMDKQTLFRTLDENEKKYITTEAHSPLFAVVMRKIGVHKQLECHGFVCQTSEDAIVIAATLYKSLVAHMKAKERRPRNRNGVTTCMSIASSLNKDKHNNSIPVRPPRKKRSSTSSVVSTNDAISISDTKPLLDNRPPKKSTKSKRAPKAPDLQNEDLDAILPYEEPISPSRFNDRKNEGNEVEIENGTEMEQVTEIKPKSFTDKLNNCMTQEQKQLAAEIKQMMSDGGTKCLKKVQSVRKNEEQSSKKENSGDILTRVTIPRSGSFLNAGGLTRYKNKVTRTNDQGSGGSPLGFKEIFNELSLQEGLHSLDDILSVIIDPEGMSFNDLKPIYKEFLLKLSLTLTKDELYQRSKSIMRRQKKKLLRKSPHQKHHIRVGGKFRRLKHIFQKNLKMRLEKKFKPPPVKETGNVLPQIHSKLPESSISSSSYDTRQFRPKDELNATKKQGYRKKSGDGNRRRRDRTSTSEESDFFSLKKSKSQGFQLLHTQNRNSSSGYVSCSECSYDSDTCTCTSADKCYCSLGQKNCNNRQNCSNATCRRDKVCSCQANLVSYCDCDTDSCADSNKCYCPSGATRSLMKEQHSFVPDEHHRHKKLCKKNSNSKSTRSLEYILNPQEKYYEKLRSKFGTRNSMPALSNVDYEHLSVVNESLRDLQNVHNRTQYSRGSLENGGGFGPCKPFPTKLYGSTRSQRQTTKMVQSSAISGASTEALSVKKSAEIAALFADIKLSQTTDITQLMPNNVDLVSLASSRSSYNKICSQAKHTKSSKLSPKQTDRRAIPHYVHPQKNHSILHSSRSGNAVKSGSSSVRSGMYQARSGKNNMYSAKNGLYTIQSQSDESRRSSTCETRKFDDRKNFFEMNPRFLVDVNSNNVSSNNIENSLGYLP